MKRKTNRGIRMLAVLAASGVCLTGCAEKKKEADFSGINSVCELATLKCYYHNVAKGETKASGLLKWFGTGYKKIWTEYSGIVDLDEDSMGEPLTDTGFLTEITKEEETAALAEAQDNMEETAKKNSALLAQAKERAKNLIEGYVKNVGEQIGEEYTIEWEEIE